MRYKGRRSIASGDRAELYVDLSEVESFLAAGHAVVKSLKTKKYQNYLFDTAFAEADEEFNVRAAAYAAVTGNISHMYEWGTVGINKGRTNMRPDPMSRQARLWNNIAEGSGFNRVITYHFLPSLANVPKPTVSATGMSTEVISKMRDHVFRWKAEMMEWGRQVTIYPEKAMFLLIPVTEENKDSVRPHDRKRGYFLTKGPITFNAGGDRYANHFTQFFMHFWMEAGDEILNDSVKRQVLMDYEPKLRGNKMANSLRPAGGSVKLRVEAMSKKIQAEVDAQAKARAAALKVKKG